MRRLPPAAGSRPVTIELNAVLVALIGEEPQVLTLQDGALLPSGPFEGDHPTLQTGLRAWVERQTHHPLGYVEQLYTFADRSRAETAAGRRIVSISYLGLTRERAAAGQHERDEVHKSGRGEKESKPIPRQPEPAQRTSPDGVNQQAPADRREPQRDIADL